MEANNSAAPLRGVGGVNRTPAYFHRVRVRMQSRWSTPSSLLAEASEMPRQASYSGQLAQKSDMVVYRIFSGSGTFVLMRSGAEL